MGHEIRHLVYGEHTSKVIIEADANDLSRQDGDYHHGLDRPIRWFDHVCANREDAEEYIESHDNGWYDNLAVKFREYPKLEPSKTMLALKTRLDNEKSKKSAYEKAHSVSSFKAEFVGCPKCGSKLKRELLKSESCPLCREELRSKTTMETLARYESNIRDLNKQIKAEERKMEEKSIKKSVIKWLVKIEYHV